MNALYLLDKPLPCTLWTPFLVISVLVRPPNGGAAHIVHVLLKMIYICLPAARFSSI